MTWTSPGIIAKSLTLSCEDFGNMSSMCRNRVVWWLSRCLSGTLRDPKRNCGMGPTGKPPNDAIATSCAAMVSSYLNEPTIASPVVAEKNSHV
ncbi:hypothetical protein RB195_017950 [Necator americanus]|uniref:Uncharacterized protein n=1 Tax=Necator americanus TaxID=51031 RepID=A0ABR1CB44_NECAM